MMSFLGHISRDNGTISKSSETWEDLIKVSSLNHLKQINQKPNKFWVNKKKQIEFKKQKK